MVSVPDKLNSPSVLEIMQRELGVTLFPVNRLDRPVSGIQILAFSGRTQEIMSRKKTVIKEYIAITEKSSIADSQTLKTYIYRDGRRRKAHCSDTPKNGYKEAVLSYSILQHLDRYFVLGITLETGRFHQIRAQLSQLGCPIRGDVKYGARRKNSDRSIDLHAHKIDIPHMNIKITAPIHREESIWKAVHLDEF